jgi:hypothetical protein
MVKLLTTPWALSSGKITMKNSAINPTAISSILWRLDREDMRTES